MSTTLLSTASPIAAVLAGLAQARTWQEDFTGTCTATPNCPIRNTARPRRWSRG